MAAEAKVPVPDQSPRQEVRLTEHLESVADPEREPSAAREVDHLAHDRAEAGDRPALEVVPVGEAARQHHDVHALEVRRLVPQIGGALSQPSVTARYTSASQFEPGNRTIPTFIPASIGSPLPYAHDVVFDDRVCDQLFRTSSR